MSKVNNNLAYLQHFHYHRGHWCRMLVSSGRSAFCPLRACLAAYFFLPFTSSAANLSLHIFLTSRQPKCGFSSLIGPRLSITKKLRADRTTFSLLESFFFLLSCFVNFVSRQFQELRIKVRPTNTSKGFDSQESQK
jgi:hypothetical protein